MNISSIFKTALLLTGCLALPTAQAETMLSCSLHYNLSGWSFVYKGYSGSGMINCSNGQRVKVEVASRGIGFTIGKSEIKGHGVFSPVKSVEEIYGSFVALEAHAGVTRSIDAQIMTRGEISLALSGSGRGVDIGATIGAFSISPIRLDPEAFNPETFNFDDNKE